MNILLALFGWLIWNFALFSMEKDKFDDAEQDFPIKPYIKKYFYVRYLYIENIV